MSHVSYLEGEPNRAATRTIRARPPRGIAVANSLEGWKDILIRTYRQVGEDRLLAVAAGVVFYGLLALFPAITALVSSYALFTDASTINDHMTMLAGILPEGALGIVRDQVNRVLAKGDVKLGLAFLLASSLPCGAPMAASRPSSMRSMWSMTRTRSAAFSSLTRFRSLHLWRAGRSASRHRLRCRAPDYPIHTRTRGGDRCALSNRTMAAPGADDAFRPRGALSVRPQPPLAAMALAERRQRICNADVACRIGPAVVLSRQLRELRRDLRFAWGRDRLDDMDVDVDDLVLFGAELNSEIEHQTAADSTEGGTSRWVSAERRWPTRSERRKPSFWSCRQTGKRNWDNYIRAAR